MSVFNIFSRFRHVSCTDTGKPLQTYSGKYKDGKATYSYYEENGERLYHGRMEYSRTYNNPPHGKGKETATGNFKDGKKDGWWFFSDRKRGDVAELKVFYTDGVPDGNYRFKSESKSNSAMMRRGKTVLQGTMSKKMPIGMIKGCFSGGVLTGECNANGLPDGTWKLDYSDAGSCKINYEEWNDGDCTGAWEFDTSTGERHKPQVHIVDFLSNFIYRECLRLVAIMPKGSSEWNGRFQANAK